MLTRRAHLSRATAGIPPRCSTLSGSIRALERYNTHFTTIPVEEHVHRRMYGSQTRQQAMLLLRIASTCSRADRLKLCSRLGERFARLGERFALLHQTKYRVIFPLLGGFVAYLMLMRRKAKSCTAERVHIHSGINTKTKAQQCLAPHWANSPSLW